MPTAGDEGLRSGAEDWLSACATGMMIEQKTKSRFIGINGVQFLHYPFVTINTVRDLRKNCGSLVSVQKFRIQTADYKDIGFWRRLQEKDRALF